MGRAARRGEWCGVAADDVADALESARIIARRYARRHWDVDPDEFDQAGRVAVWRAARRFDPAAGIRFATFARHRTAGAMLDVLRGNHLLATPGQVRRAKGDLPRVRRFDDRRRGGRVRAAAFDPAALDCPVDAVRRLVGRLDPHADGQTLEFAGLYYGAGLTCGDIGRRAGLSEGRVYQVLARMRARCRRSAGVAS